MYRSFTRTFLLLLLAVLIAGCGFHPRGQGLRLERVPQPLLIVGVPAYSDLGQALRKQLRSAGLRLTEHPDEAAATLRIADHRSDSRVLSLDANNRATEYELAESLRFSLRSESGVLVQPQLVRVVRTLLKPTTQIVAASREEDSLRQRMREELAGRIVRRLAAQTR